MRAAIPLRGDHCVSAERTEAGRATHSASQGDAGVVDDCGSDLFGEIARAITVADHSLSRTGHWWKRISSLAGDFDLTDFKAGQLSDEEEGIAFPPNITLILRIANT